MSGLPRRSTAPFIRKALILPLSLCFAACFSGALASGDEIQANWNGGNGNWFPAQVQNTNWTCASVGPCVPSGLGYDANIENGTVYLNEPVSVDAISLGNGKGAFGVLDISSSANSLTVNTITVGDAGVGQLTVQSGGAVTSKGQLIIGSQASGTGDVAVTGPGSTLNSEGAVYVGNNGGADMVVNGGGVVNGAGFFFGARSTLIIDAGSALNNQGPLSVGQGFMSIDNGGVVNNNGDTLIGAQPAPTGMLWVREAGSQLNNMGNLYVGNTGTGTLLIASGGQVTSKNGTIGLQSGSQGFATVTGAGSQWINSGSLNVGPLGSGYLYVNDGGLVSANTITIGASGAALIGSGTLSANTITNQGTIYDDFSKGTQINLKGNFILAPGGTEEFAITGNDTGAYTVLDISGSSLFQGTLRIDFFDNFAPKKGDTFDLINDPEGANFTGATFEITGLEKGFEYATSFSDGMFILTALNNSININTPEPGTLGLLAAALAISFGIHFRRRIAMARRA